MSPSEVVNLALGAFALISTLIGLFVKRSDNKSKARVLQLETERARVSKDSDIQTQLASILTQSQKLLETQFEFSKETEKQRQEDAQAQESRYHTLVALHNELAADTYRANVEIQKKLDILARQEALENLAKTMIASLSQIAQQNVLMVDTIGAMVRSFESSQERLVTNVIDGMQHLIGTQKVLDMLPGFPDSENPEWNTYTISPRDKAIQLYKKPWFDDDARLVNGHSKIDKLVSARCIVNLFMDWTAVRVDNSYGWIRTNAAHIERIDNA